MYGISKNPSITMKDIEDNPEFDWCWIGISNPNVTQKFYYKNIDKHGFGNF